MPYTHLFNLCALLFTLVSSIALSLGLYIGIQHLNGLPNPPNVSIIGLLWVVGVLFCGFYLWFCFQLTLLAADWLYLLIFRRTRVSWSEIKTLYKLFRLNKELTWFPMKEINTLPRDQRVPYMRKILTEAIANGIIK
jgi:hypothetical protein